MTSVIEEKFYYLRMSNSETLRLKNLLMTLPIPVSEEQFVKDVVHQLP
jgi:hypothetical protein